MPVDPEHERLARQRITAVFRFLKAFNEIRNPVIRHITEQPWVLNLRSLPSHPAVAIGQYEEPAAPQDEPPNAVEQAPTDVSPSFILKVRRPSLNPPPAPPPEIADWVDPGWDDPDGEVTIRGVHRTEAEAGDGVEPFDGDPVRPEKLEEWRSTREGWAQKEKPARAALSVFERLYEIHTQMERESERFELVLGEGVLRWMTEGSLVHHPILLQRLQITFDPNVPEFTLSQTDHPIELYSALFSSLENVDNKALGDRIAELGYGVIHPLAGKATADFLTRVAVSLHARGEFIGDAEPAGEAPYPRIGRDPVVFMRARTLGFATAIEDVLRDLERGSDLPVALMRLVGIDPQPLHDNAPETTDVLDTGNDDDEVLFTKPANLEQLRIARRLQRFDGVQVQGPPGTGKTHTIGNLIGHLLAQGKSILITSHTTKALRMVRDQVAEEIRPLCVSVLDRDTAGQEQLRASVGTIVSKVTDDLPEIERRARVLGEKRKALVSQFRQAKQELLEVRGTEYIPVTVGGESRSPSDAARLVAAGRAQNDWIPPPVTPNAVLPISVQELVELYATNSLLSATDERELESVLPPLEALITPVAFAEAVEELGRLRGTDLAYGRQFWSSVTGEPELAFLRNLATAIDRAIEPLTRQEQWRLAAIEAGQRGSVERIPWDNLIELIANVGELAGAGREAIIRYNPSIQSDRDVSEILPKLGEIVGHFQKGGKLSWLTYTTHRSWKRVLACVSVAGQPPTSAEEINAVLQLARLTQARRELLSRWERMAVPLGLPSAEDFGDQPEVILAQLSAQIKDALEWYPGTWLPLASQLKRLGFGLEEFLKRGEPSLRLHGDLIHLSEHFREEFAAVLTAQVNRSLDTVVEQRMARLEGSVAVLARSGRPSQALRQLVDAIHSREAAAYRNAFERIADLHGRRTTLERRQLLLSRLRSVASAWAEAIHIRRSPHDVDMLPGDPEAAWLWRQLDQELEILAQRSVEQSQDRVLKISDELNQTTSELVAMRAWGAQVRSLTTSKRQALLGWLLAKRRFGGGHGRFAPKWQAIAQQYLRDAVKSVPVWIMPLTRVVENFKGSEKFDVVVIDEASQSDLMGLIALYMGREVVVVGDDQQVSPLAVGINQDQEEKLQDQFLGGVPNARLYNGQTSLYDLAAMCLGSTVRLLEHFRCVPEIIAFSNYLSYQGDIKPLRDTTSTRLK
ncbi:MAG: AAA domain-containing protein, partial [Bacillota bacterium]|nr:AAA domain-containing protein [Bacillota bacterium]